MAGDSIERMNIRNDGYSATAEDIADREIEALMSDRAALARLVTEHRLFREAIEKSPVAYCVYDADDRLIAFNPAYESLHTGVGSMRDAHARGERLYYADIMRKQLIGQVPPEELEAAVAERVRDQRSSDSMTVDRDNGDKGQYRITKYHLSCGAVAGLAFDITEQKMREKELTAATALAEQAQRVAQEALDTERKRKRDVRLLAELGEWLQSCKTMDELFTVIERFMATLFPGSAGELFIYSNSRDVLDNACHWNRDGHLDDYIRPDDCWALRRGRMYKHGAGSVDFVCHHADDLGAAHGETPYVCLPIIAHGDTVGLLHIRFAAGEGTGREAAKAIFDDNVHTFAIQCSEQISLAIANGKLRDELRDQSTRDPLTGLFNRRHFLEECRRELSNAMRYEKPLSLIAVDVDNFKMFNDTHGHDAGDTVLRTLGDLMETVFEGCGVVSRFGGEEFSILLPETGIDLAESRAEELRRRTESLSIRYGDKILPKITISAGLAAYPSKGSTPQELLNAADRALYTAKDAGRNIVRKAES